MPASLAEVLADCIQPIEPQTTILAVLEQHHGEPIRFLIDKMRQISKEYTINLTLIDRKWWLTWGPHEQPTNVMLVSTSGTTQPNANAPWVKANNPHLFVHISNANAIRKKYVNQPNHLEAIRLERLLLQYKELTMELEKYFRYPSEFWADKDQIQEAYGLRFDGLREYPF